MSQRQPTPESAGASAATSKQVALVDAPTAVADPPSERARSAIASISTVGSQQPHFDSESRSDPIPPVVAALFVDVFKTDEAGIAAPSHVQVHRKLAAELEDDAWSPYMEANLRQYFQRQPGMDRIEILVLDCRATICEIQAAGFHADDKPADHESDPTVRFQRIVYAIDKEPWGTELTNYGVLVTSSNDRTLFVVHLVRKR